MTSVSEKQRLSVQQFTDFRSQISDLWQLAAGSKELAEETKEELGALFESRKVEEKGGQYELHERQEPFNSGLVPKIDVQGTMNTYQWQ